jgi:hypothetical protein
MAAVTAVTTITAFIMTSSISSTTYPASPRDFMVTSITINGNIVVLADALIVTPAAVVGGNIFSVKVAFVVNVRRMR